MANLSGFLHNRGHSGDGGVHRVYASRDSVGILREGGAAREVESDVCVFSWIDLCGAIRVYLG